jgi:hypothetical protein
MLRVTYICGATSLLELGGLRLLKVPTFDPGPRGGVDLGTFQ